MKKRQMKCKRKTGIVIIPSKKVVLTFERFKLVKSIRELKLKFFVGVQVRIQTFLFCVFSKNGRVLRARLRSPVYETSVFENPVEESQHTHCAICSVSEKYETKQIKATLWLSLAMVIG